MQPDAFLKSGLTKWTFRDRLADRLAHMIQSGLLRVGDELPSERDLAATLDVSRETIRGAIQLLAGMGMLEISQGSRTRVLRVEGYVGSTRELRASGYDANIVHRARRVLELPIVRAAAECISQKDLDRLHALVEAQKQMVEDPVRFQISDTEFHGLIYRAGDNPLLAEYMRDIYSFALDYRRRAMIVPGAVLRSWNDHCEIVKALDARDADAAAEAMDRHICRVHSTTLLAMSNDAASQPLDAEASGKQVT